MATSDDLYHQILTNGPSAETLFIVLSKLRAAGQYNRVIRECITALHMHPNDILLRQLLAETYFDAGLLAHAETELEKVISNLDHLAPLYKLQAQVLYKQRREEEAMKSLRIFLAHRPDDQEALRFLQLMEAPLMEAPPQILPEAPPPAPEVSTSVRTLPVGAPEPPEEIPEPIVESIEEESLPEIVTPTLAEVYVNQGQIKEAIHIYEKIVTRDADDLTVRRRIEELRAMIAAKTPAESVKRDREGKSREKIISTLEMWLEEMRKTPKDSAPA
jgi:tetratricopeptide (TPR) repeat protein